MDMFTQETASQILPRRILEENRRNARPFSAERAVTQVCERS